MGLSFTTNAHSVTVIDAGRVVDLIKTFVTGLSRDDSAVKFVEAFQSLSLLRENSTATDEGFESRSVLTFR